VEIRETGLGACGGWVQHVKFRHHVNRWYNAKKGDFALMATPNAVPDQSIPSLSTAAAQISAVPPVATQQEAVSADSPDRMSIPLRVDTWEDYFLNIAKVVSIKSKDPRCPVGAVIVSEDNIILSTGFNGLARGVHDDEAILADAHEKINVICHAENNAISNAARVGGRPLQGTTIYVTKFPCLACCNNIVQAGIKRIITHDDAFWDDDPADKDHSRKKRVLHEAHIVVNAPFHAAFKPSEQIVVPKRRARKKPQGSVAAPEQLPLKNN
jgi:dCMP deaminase